MYFNQKECQEFPPILNVQTQLFKKGTLHITFRKFIINTRDALVLFVWLKIQSYRYEIRIHYKSM